MTNAIETNARRVLVVDDEPAILSYLAEFLRKLNFDPVTAADRDEALKVIDDSKQTGFDYAVVDLVLGSDSGVELVKLLTARYPRLRVLLISGYADAMVERGTMPDGARIFFLRKVFSPEQFKEAVEKMSEAE